MGIPPSKSRKCVPTWDTKKEGCAFTGQLPAAVQSSKLARGAVKHPLGVSSPCLQHFRSAAAVKARPVRRLVGSVGDCVKQSPSLDGRCSAEYPPRRGVTPSFPFSIYWPGIRAFLSMLSAVAVRIAPCAAWRCDILVDGAADAFTHVLNTAEGLPDLRRGPAVIQVCYPCYIG